MSPIVFLDIDGVLNGHGMDPMSLCGEIHPDKIRRLNRLLFITGAKIVLSSAWRYIIHRHEAKLQGIDWLLRSHGLHSGRLHGITRADTMEPGEWDGRYWPVVNERGRQISDWLHDNWIRQPYGEKLRYVVIDDLDLGISEAGHPLVLTDGRVGLTDADVDRASGFLRRPSGVRAAS